MRTEHAIETAHKNGYDKGYTEGYAEGVKDIVLRLKQVFYSEGLGDSFIRNIVDKVAEDAVKAHEH